jgi:hypothetical protein
MGAAIELTAYLNTVPNHFAFAMRAGRRDSLNRALKAVECVSRAVRDQFESLVIVVSTNLALCHGTSPPGAEWIGVRDRKFT